MAIDYELLSTYSTILDTSTYSKLSLANYNKAILNRGLQNKTYKELADLKAFYPEKIKDIQDLKQQYVDYKIAATPEERTERITQFDEKLKRLVDKYACTLKEIDIRDRSLVERQVL